MRTFIAKESTTLSSKKLRGSINITEGEKIAHNGEYICTIEGGITANIPISIINKALEQGILQEITKEKEVVNDNWKP